MIRCLPLGGRAIAAAGSTTAGAGTTGRIRPFASTPARRRSSPSIRAKARSAEAAPPALSTRSPTWWWAIRPPRRTSPLPQAAARPAEAAFQAAVFPAAVSPAQAPLRASNPCFGARACTVGGFLSQPRPAPCSPKSRAGNEESRRLPVSPAGPEGGACRPLGRSAGRRRRRSKPAVRQASREGPRNRR